MDALAPGILEATEEAIVNALIAACDRQRPDGHRVTANPHATLCERLRRYRRLVTP